MAALWSEQGVACVHPGWMPLHGRDEVLRSYKLILANPDQEAVAARQARAILDGDIGRVLCVESVGGGLLAATNVFRRENGSWRLVHHHASPIVARTTRTSAPGWLN
jgi:ketosteroid isomerase-like protein